jgi:ankyrin repeat protein
MGEAPAVKLLLDANADTKARDKDGWSAFRYGIYSGSPATVRYLLKYQADINEVDREGNTPMMWYSPFDTADILRILIDAKADINPKNKSGETPLMNSATRFFRNEVDLLIRSGADVRAIDNRGSNALMHTAVSIYRRDEVGAHGNGFIRWLAATSIIDLLIDKGINVNAVNKQGETALILAMKAGNAHFASQLLSRGADPSVRTKYGARAKDFIEKIPKPKRQELLSALGT